MAPSKPGGRPKNAWNSSRKRKLVRLYTLTSLSKEEIQQVLKAHDFNPSSSDIQKRLRELFPRDYAKEYHQYRPPNGSLATVRLKRLQQRRQARKSRAAHITKDKQTLSLTHGEDAIPSKDPYQAFEGPLSAFRNYSGGYNGSENWPRLVLSGHPSESQLVVPSLLLLDGTSIAGTAVTPHDELRCHEVPSLVTAAHPSSTNHSTPAPSPGHSYSASRQSSVVSFRSLEARLLHRSSSVIRHVQSVLRYSSTSSCRSSASWRSSWPSFESRMSTQSVISSATSSTDGDPNSTDKARFNHPSESESIHLPAEPVISLVNLRKELSKNLEMTWPELVSEHVFHRKRYKIALRYTSFVCDCIYGRGPQSLKQNGTISCELCGIRHVHLLALSLAGAIQMQNLPLTQLNQKDHLDNGPLHFAARVRNSDPNTFIKLIGMGADFQSVTTSGATFLHVLFQNLKLTHLSKFIPLLRYLATLEFPFSSRDYCGRQPFHLLFQGAGQLRLDSLTNLEEVAVIMEPDVDAMDSAGCSIRTPFSNLVRRAKIKTQSGEFPSRYPVSANARVDFKTAFSEMDFDWTTYITWLAMNDRSAWVDRNGDTALIALLKYWKYDQDELLLDTYIKELVSLGSQIHMRDRHGETALAIAARQGLRPAVKTLIGLGASIHTMNHQHTSILVNTRKRMAQAKKRGDDKLHAMIWSCIVYLLDLEAYERPPRHRQLWAAWAPDILGADLQGERISRALSESGLL